MLTETTVMSPSERARFIKDRIPSDGLFFGHEWRISPEPFPIGEKVAKEFETLGRVLLQFYRAINLLYRQSVDGKQPAWVAAYLEHGKPADLLSVQRSHALKNEVPRVIRPDVLLTDSGPSIIELDSVPGGIGLTAWLNQTYAEISPKSGGAPASAIVGGPDGMLAGFAGIFGEAPAVHIVVSEEAATYRPEMAWVSEQLGTTRFKIQNPSFDTPTDGDAVYRFFELFDVANVPGASKLFALAEQKRIRLTPPPKPIFEEKMLFALLWNRNLQGFWRQQLGESFFQRMLQLVPYSWIVDPAPLPPHGAIPELNLTDWQQLKTLSQRERNLILKISGYSPKAWGSRGVFLGSDLSHGDWSAAVDTALGTFTSSPYVLQRYHHPRLVEASYFDFEKNQLIPMPGRVRLCPYYFVIGEGDAARAQLGGVLATICPADKKLIHGMKDAILAPCSTVPNSL
jgi:hypothetical protein